MQAAVQLPGWGDWGGLGAHPSRRQQQRQLEAAAAREQMLAAAAARRKDAALRNVIISEKRDKKAAKFTTAGVPFPFTSREQFERSLRNPVGLEWNTAGAHEKMVAPRVQTAKGALISPIKEHLKRAPPGTRKK